MQFSISLGADMQPKATALRHGLLAGQRQRRTSFMNKRLLYVVVSFAALVGCASVEPPPKVSVPTAWAQKAEEVGRLQAGRIVSVTKGDLDLTPWSRGQTVTTVAPIGGGFVPITGRAINVLGIGERKQEYYKYAVKQKGKTELVYWGEFVVYEVGSCVALREEPGLMIVPAAPQACD